MNNDPKQIISSSQFSTDSCCSSYCAVVQVRLERFSSLGLSRNPTHMKEKYSARLKVNSHFPLESSYLPYTDSWRRENITHVREHMRVM